MKKRGQLEVFVPVRSSAGTGVAGTPVTIQAAPRGSGTSGSASANRLLGDEPLMRDVMTGQASLLQQGRDKKLRKLENKLSSLTTAFASGVRKMLDYMRQVQNDPAITDEVKAAVQGILNNEGGIMKFVIDVREGVRIGSRELPLAKRMIELAFESYMAGRGTVKTQLQVVLRKVDASGKAEEITL
ncbi:MAG TPA: hypothetical protein VNN08_17910 [Thermoanaerobaculia bacterium]|nr:hypothetical protein [Thermoanaerobaculia bacterium]